MTPEELVEAFGIALEAAEDLAEALEEAESPAEVDDALQLANTILQGTGVDVLQQKPHVVGMYVRREASGRTLIFDRRTFRWVVQDVHEWAKEADAG